MSYKIWAIIIVLVIIAVIVLFKIIKNKIKEKSLHGLDKKEFIRKWNEIETLLRRNDEMSYKLAVLEADKLLDHTLKFLFFPGSTLGERLKAACYKYQNLRQVWWAHKIRNKLVHETNFHLNSHTANNVIKSFKKAFKELGVL